MSMRGNATKVLSATFRTATEVGATLPKTLKTDHDKLAGQASKIDGLTTGTDIAGVALAALIDGRDPATDPTVHAEVTRKALTGAEHGLREALADRAQELVDAHMDGIVEAFRGPFDKAATDLTRARETLGDVPLDDTATVLSRGGNAAQAWADARAAEGTITSIRNAWRMLATVTTVREAPRHELLITTDVPPTTWLDDQLTGQNVTPWAAVCAGYTLSLATGAEFAKRVHAVTVEMQRRQEEAQRNQERFAFGKRAS